MRPIYGRHEKFRESLATPMVIFPNLLMTLVVINRMKVHQMAHVGISRSRGLTRLAISSRPTETQHGIPRYKFTPNRILSYSAAKLFSKNSNLCDYGT